MDRLIELSILSSIGIHLLWLGPWYAIATNIEALTKKKTCAEVIDRIKEDGIYATRYFTDVDTSTDVKINIEFLFLKRGRFTEYHEYADGQYKSTGWVHSLMKADGQFFLRHECKEKGDQHFAFYRIWTHTIPVPDKTMTVLKDAYNATGNTKPHYLYNNEKCHFKSN